jgi:hypothetical protein
MKIRSTAMVAASAVALANTVAAQTRPSSQLPAKFLGCYVEQPISPCGCAIKVGAKTWTTGEDWTCDTFSVVGRGDGIIVNQTCGGEGLYGRYREYWQLHKVGNMTLLIRTDAKSLKSIIFIRCQGN